MGEVALLLASVSVLLALDEWLSTRKRRVAMPHARARSFVPHARQVTRSFYMAYPQEIR